MAGDQSRMAEFFKSASRCCWATALFGVSQLRNALPPRDASRASGAFDSVTTAAEGQLGDFLRRAFRAGDQAQRGLIDFASDALTPDTFTSRGMMRMTLNAMRQSAGALGQLMPAGGGRAALQEFRSKLQVFDLFENVDAVLRLPRERGVPLAELTAPALRLDSYLSVWATEGVGHYYAETAWGANDAPRGLLRGDALGGVPARCMVALHAGVGLSLANRVLGAVRQRCGNCPPSGDLREALRQFVALCRDNSAEGYIGATYEALGLVARNLYPHLLLSIDRQLSEMGDDLADYFWHGAGRAIYFAPTNYLPLGNAVGRVIEAARRGPPHEAGRRNALAGAAWAMLLVNVRWPEVVENLLGQCDDGTLDRDAFANGVSSAAMIWRDSAEDDPHLEALRRHQPDPSRTELAERWRALIEVPSGLALDEYYGLIKRHGRIGELFRYRSLPELLGELTRVREAGGVRGREGASGRASTL
jgi:hypothetical protein